MARKFNYRYEECLYQSKDVYHIYSKLLFVEENLPTNDLYPELQILKTALFNVLRDFEEAGLVDFQLLDKLDPKYDPYYLEVPAVS